MRLSRIPAIRNNIFRAREIIGVLSKYGLAEGIRWVAPHFARDLLKTSEGTAIARQRWETRVRLAMTELGPSTIKLGQFLSTRPDLIGVELADELKHLQGDVPPDSFEYVRAAIEKSLRRPIEEVFESFEETPMASGSIGQVHRAVVRGTGEVVAVKVQHRDILRRVETDLDIIAALAQVAENFPEFENYHPTGIVRSFRRTFLRELDFRREARYMERFAADFQGNPTIRIPKVLHKLSSRDVLTMEFIEGVKVADRERLEAEGYDLDEVARRGAKLYMEMIFQNRFFHADPHPGNIVLLDENVIGLLDYGNVGQLDEPLREGVEEMLLAINAQDAEYLTSIIIRLGHPPTEFDRAELSLDVEDFVSFHGTQNVEDIDVSAALNEMTEIIRRYKIQLQPRMALLIKVLVTLEGTAKLLSPRFSLLDVMRPYRFRMLRERLSPRRYYRKFRLLFSQVERAISILPEGMIEIFQRVQSGKFIVHLDHRGLEPSVNRLVLGLMTSALFLGSSLMLSQDVPPLMNHISIFGWTPFAFDVSLPGVLGIFGSLVTGLWLVRAIHKSGNLD